jgi:hypothetical protein
VTAAAGLDRGYRRLLASAPDGISSGPTVRAADPPGRSAPAHVGRPESGSGGPAGRGGRGATAALPGGAGRHRDLGPVLDLQQWRRLLPPLALGDVRHVLLCAGGSRPGCLAGTAPRTAAAADLARGLALAVAAAATGILWKLTYGVYLSSGPAAQRAAALIVLGSIAIAMVMSSRLGRHLVVLFAIMFYPVALALARETAYVPLPVAMTRSWLALMYLPPLLLAAMAVAGSRRSREGIRPAASLDAPARPGYPDICPGAGTAASVRASTSRRRNRGTGRHGRTDDWFRPVWCSMPVPLPPGTAFRLMDAG